MNLGAMVPMLGGGGRVIDWRSPTKRPIVVTVTLAPILEVGGTFPDLADSLLPFRATVGWGCDEVGVSAVIDYPMMGGTFTLTTSAVYVDVAPTSLVGFGLLTTNAKIGGYVSEGASRPAATLPTFTFTLGVDSTTGGAPTTDLNGGIVPIPRFARAYWIEDNNSANIVADTRAYTIEVQNRGQPAPQPGALIQILRLDTQSVTAATQRRSTPSPTEPMPLPPRATHLNIVRVAGYGPASSRLAVVYQLDLGA